MYTNDANANVDADADANARANANGQLKAFVFGSRRRTISGKYRAHENTIQEEDEEVVTDDSDNEDSDGDDNGMGINPEEDIILKWVV